MRAKAHQPLPHPDSAKHSADEYARKHKAFVRAAAERDALRAICAELRDHLLLVLPAIDSWAAASPVMVGRASDARATLKGRMNEQPLAAARRAERNSTDG